MGNKIDNQTNIILNQNANIKINNICQKCPLTPIINISSTKEGTIICEYRCPSFHMGLVKLEEMILKKNSRSKRYGCICQLCKKETENTLGQKKFRFCGFCKLFLCEECINENQSAVNDYLSGKEKALQCIIGKVMAKTKGRADAAKVKSTIVDLISKKKN